MSRISSDRVAGRSTRWMGGAVLAGAVLAGALVASLAGWLPGGLDPTVALAQAAPGQAAPEAQKEQKPSAAAPAAEAKATPESRPAPALGRLAATPTAGAGAADPINDLESLTPPDGKWEVDQDGREFFVTRLKKVKDTYYKVSEDKITYKRFYHWDVAREDAEYFYIKVYRPLENEEQIIADREQEERERMTRIEESYRFEDRRVDRLVFSAFDTGLPREGQWRQGFDVADMNGDGHLDIVHGTPRKAIFTPVIFLGDGAGNWRYWEEVTWPKADFDYGDAAAGDVNGDGLMDIGLGVHLRGVQVLIQEKPGRFVDASAGLSYEVPGKGGDASGFASRAVQFFDWNGDGRLDLVALGEGARQASTAKGVSEGLPQTSAYGIVVFQNLDGKSWKPLSAGTRRGVFGDGFTIGNFNADDRPDIATASYVMGSRRILFLNADTPQGWEEGTLDSLRLRAFTYAVTSGDFDGDKRDDLVTTFGTHDGDVPRSGIELHTRDAQGVWSARNMLIDGAGEAIWAIDSGDLDGDGNRDVVATTHQGRAIVLLGDGKGGFAREESPELDSPKACRGYTVRLVDLDGDRRPEMVASFSSETGELKRFLGEPECEGEGELRAWRAAPSPAPAKPQS